MAAGDTIGDLVEVAGGGTNYTDIRPSAGEEYIIHNVYYGPEDGTNWTGGAVRLFRVKNAGKAIEIDSDTTRGYMGGRSFHVTNTHFLRVYNTHATDAVVIGWDGVQWK